MVTLTFTNANAECTHKARTEKYHLKYYNILGVHVINHHSAIVYSTKNTHPKYSTLKNPKTSLKVRVWWCQIKHKQREKSCKEKALPKGL